VRDGICIGPVDLQSMVDRFLQSTHVIFTETINISEPKSRSLTPVIANEDTAISCKVFS